MNDTIRITFSAADQTGQAVINHAQTLYESLDRLQSTTNNLLNTSLQGGFLDELDARCSAIYNQLHFVCDETNETGNDLLTTAEWFRQLDAQIAAAWGISHQLLDNALLSTRLVSAPLTGGGGSVLGVSTSASILTKYSAVSTRLESVNDSIMALQDSRNMLNLQITEINQYIRDNPFWAFINRILGTDYDAMKSRLQDSINRTDGHLAALQGEQSELTATKAFLDEKRSLAGTNQNLVAGCTAFVANHVYVPWETPLGNAGQWADKARQFDAQPGNESYGISVDGTPSIGSIICLPDAAWGAGHVGIVTNIKGNVVTISNGDTAIDGNGNWNQPWGTWTPAPDREYDISQVRAEFIHLPWSE
jgi:surface antigen